MQNWLMYGIIASLFWGSWVIALKVATSQKYYGLSSSAVPILASIGILAASAGYALYEGKFALPNNFGGIGFGILAGVLWGAGLLFSVKALSAGADVAKLTPIYNTNTLIAVLLGILLLRELPASGEVIKVLFGAILIVVGSILVSF